MEPCSNCSKHFPGKIIKVNNLRERLCIECGKKINVINTEPSARWDSYFLTICKSIASKSPCLSRQIGAILVRDKSIISTGYNGPARNFPHCEGQCRRKNLGLKSGEGLHLCPAAHAELNCIANAARNGVSTIGTTLYMNCIIPCKDCMIALVNAGIKEVVITKGEFYHTMSEAIAEHGNILVREFSHE
jgi:dCMP deaminase